MDKAPLSLLEFLADLSSRKISYKLSHNRNDGIMVEVCVPGERWEVEFMSDGTLEIERFLSDGTIYDSSALDVLRDKFSD